MQTRQAHLPNPASSRSLLVVAWGTLWHLMQMAEGIVPLLINAQQVLSPVH